MRRLRMAVVALVTLLSLVGCNDSPDDPGNGGSTDDVAVDTASDTQPGDDTETVDGSADMGVPTCNSQMSDCPSGRWCNTSSGECASCPIETLSCDDFEAGDSSIDPDTSRVSVKFAWGSVHIESISFDAEEERPGTGSGWGELQSENKSVEGPTTANVNFAPTGSGDSRLNSVTVTDVCGDTHELSITARWQAEGDVTEELSCEPMGGGGG